MPFTYAQAVLPSMPYNPETAELISYYLAFHQTK
jgi:hypothetical protein